MDLWLLDTDFASVCVVDDYESAIWTDRYNKPGEFELYLSSEAESAKQIDIDYYLYQKNSGHLMIVESIEVDSDVESGAHLIIKGRSLESILERRIVWEQTIFDGNFQNAIKTLLNDAIISPTDTNRQIPNFVFKESDDERITDLSISVQFTGDDLLTAITNMCAAKDVGFRIELSDENKFVFSLYVGDDRTYDQTDNPYVVFSSEFDNLLNSNYLKSKNTLKTVTLVAGEGEGSARRKIEVGDTSITGINRRELFTDARDISSTSGETTIPDSEYFAQLTERGNEKLSENKEVNAFEGQAVIGMMFVYGTDFYMGDVIQLRNELGMEGKVRVTEFVMSDSDTGYEEYPTFVMIDEEE